MISTLKEVREALFEATSYTSSQAWSPSMTRDCEAALTKLDALIAEQEKAEPVGDMPDCYVVVKDGQILGTHDEPGHVNGIEAVRYVPASGKEFYERRVNALQKWQSKMRDPERIIVCDIIANGCTLDPAGSRYTTPQSALSTSPET